MGTKIEKSEVLIRQLAAIDAEIEFSHGVREYSKGQAELWAQVPYKMLMASGMGQRSSYPPFLRGFIPIEGSKRANGSIAVWVEAESGTLLRGSVPHLPEDPEGMPKSLTDIAANNDLLSVSVDELDAEAVLAKLDAKIKAQEAYGISNLSLVE